MADEGRTGKTKRRSRGLDSFFYLNGELHRRLEVNRSEDIIIAWSYPQHKRVGYTYSDVRKRAKKAYLTRQVGELLGRASFTIKMLYINGEIESPQFAYGLKPGPKEGMHTRTYYWQDSDIYAARDVLSQRMKNKGQDVPTARELRAMLEHGTILYVKTADGNFVPTWEAENF